MTTERTESTNLCKFLEDKVRSNKQHLGEFFEVVERRHVISDFTIAPDKNRDWKAYPGTLQQDIIIKLKDAYVRRDLVCELSPKKELVIPIVIVQRRRSSTFNTHHLITSSAIAGRVKQIFPLCRCFYAIEQEERKTRRLRKVTELRHAGGFDGFFEDFAEDRDVLWESIRLHLAHVAKYHVGNKLIT